MKIFLPSLLIFSSLFSSAQNGKYNPTHPTPDMDKTLIYLPATSFTYVQIDAVDPSKALTEKVISLKSFYAFPYEVSNGMYLEYISELKKNNVPNLAASLPDTTVWRSPLAYNEPYVDYYFRHPAYSEYPVVGLTQKQCENYCAWLSAKYNDIEKRKFKKVKFRLPTANEWYRIAISNADYLIKENDVKSIGSGAYQTFPWDGPYIRKPSGEKLANFRQINEADLIKGYDTITNINGRQYIRTIYFESYHGGGLGDDPGVAGQLNDVADITAPVKSYWATKSGIYNLAGNVEEFVAEFGITKGGSWRDTGYYLRNDVYEIYDSTTEVTCTRGFRFVMEVVEEF